MDTKKEIETESAVRDSKHPIYWIPFSIAAILLVVVGLFRFPSSDDNAYFIYTCLIAFALATLPWISSFRVNGLFEIERTIEKTKEETKERIEQTDKRFEDRLLSVRAELISSINSTQSQLSQQLSVLNSTQTQVSQQSMLQALRQSNSLTVQVGSEVAKVIEKREDKPNGEDQSQKSVKNKTEQALDNITLSPADLLKLKESFAQSTAAALDDPLGAKCGKLLRTIPNDGVSVEKFFEQKKILEVSDEQIQTLKNLHLISITQSEMSKDEVITITPNGKIYSEYWKLNFALPDWASALLSIGTLAGLTYILNKDK
jgi:hypothetical protein